MKTIHYPLTAKQLNSSFDLSARIQITDQTGQVFLSSEPELEADQTEERLEFCQHLAKLANENHAWNEGGTTETNNQLLSLYSFKDILVEIENERLRQLGKWSDEPTHHGLNHLIICLNKHLGLAAFSLLGSSYKETQKRVVQVAALCVALYQTINRLLELKGKG